MSEQAGPLFIVTDGDPPTVGEVPVFGADGFWRPGAGGGGGGSESVTEVVDLTGVEDVIGQGGSLGIIGNLFSVATPTSDPDFFLWSMQARMDLTEPGADGGTITINLTELAQAVPAFSGITAAPMLDGGIFVYASLGGLDTFGFVRSSDDNFRDLNGAPIQIGLLADDGFMLSASCIVSND